MEKFITDELIRRAIIMSLANIELEEEFQANKNDDFLIKPQKLEQKIKKKVLGNERHLG